MTQDTYKWMDNPTVSGVSKCDTDILNDCLMHLKYDKKDGSGGFNLFDTKVSDHILQGEEAIGWALQGSMVTMTYPDAVAKIKSEYESGIEDEYAEYENITIPTFTSNSTGEITVSDARSNADAYTLMNGVTYKAIGDFSTYWYKIQFDTPSTIKSYAIKADSSAAPEYPTGWKVQGSMDSETWVDLDTKTNMVFTLGEEKKFYISTQEEYTIYRILFTAGNVNGELGKLSFDVKKKKFHYTYKKAQNGHKIADISQKDAIDELYVTTGVADFYILDSDNNQFYLPRNKYFTQFTDDVSKVNNFVKAGLPNVTCKMSQNGLIQDEPALPYSDYSTFSGYTSHNPVGALTATCLSQFSLGAVNPIYGNSDTVQPSSSLKLLYYKVGDVVVNESLIDIGQVLSDLQLKADIDLSNATLSQAFKNEATSWGMPSNKYIDLTLKASEGTYVAPANGWFVLDTNPAGASNQYLTMINLNTLLAFRVISVAQYNTLGGYVPAIKNETIRITYIGLSARKFRFVYAEGAKND